MHFLILYTLEFNEFSLNQTKANISIVKLELFFSTQKNRCLPTTLVSENI